LYFNPKRIGQRRRHLTIPGRPRRRCSARGSRRAGPNADLVHRCRRRCAKPGGCPHLSLQAEHELSHVSRWAGAWSASAQAHVALRRSTYAFSWNLDGVPGGQLEACALYSARALTTPNRTGVCGASSAAGQAGAEVLDESFPGRRLPSKVAVNYV
jgi:hypothetical protein